VFSKFKVHRSMNVEIAIEKMHIITKEMEA
jgi:hypothetical protein